MFTIEQGICTRDAAGRVTWFGRSAGLLDEWAEEVERLCEGFGERPAGVACPGAVFARPFGKQNVAVVRVVDAAGSLSLRFHFLILDRGLYSHLGDPFAVADRYPAPEAKGDLPTLEWPPDPLPRRTVGQIQKVLKEGDGPFLLGAAQALIDGSKLVVERPAPDTDLARSLWALLPSSTRAELWPASFAFGNALGFDLVVLPKLPEELSPGYLTEEQCKDYPQGRYELNLQIAVEAGDQAALDGLLARRSSRETLRLAAWLVVAMLLVGLVMKVLVG